VRIRLSYITSLFAAAAAAAAITTAPSALAAPTVTAGRPQAQETRIDSGPNASPCPSPGNVLPHNSPPYPDNPCYPSYHHYRGE
jgi:hypothetical protein